MPADSLVVFGPAHLATLAVIAAATAGLSLLLRRLSSDPRGHAAGRRVCLWLGALIVVNAVAGDAREALTGVWTLAYSLPLHLCDIAGYAVAAALVTAPWPPAAPRFRSPRANGAQQAWISRHAVGARQWTFELAYFWGIGGGVQALLTPEIHEGFPRIEFIQFFVGHGAALAAVLALTIGLRERPLRGAVARAWLSTNILAAFVGLVDWLTGANYMYLCGPPARESLYDWLGPWPWPLASAQLIGVAVFLLCYAPFWTIDRAFGRANETNAAE